MAMKRLTRRTSVTLAVSLLGLASAMLMLAPVSASANVVSCRWPWPGNTQVPPQEYIVDISARNMSCGAAVGAISRGYWVRGKRDFWKGQSVFRTRGFFCYPISSGGGGQTVRCVRGAAALRFSWGT
jgi:hypothetical protein